MSDAVVVLVGDAASTGPLLARVVADPPGGGEAFRVALDDVGSATARTILARASEGRTRPLLVVAFGETPAPDLLTAIAHWLAEATPDRRALLAVPDDDAAAAIAATLPGDAPPLRIPRIGAEAALTALQRRFAPSRRAARANVVTTAELLRGGRRAGSTPDVPRPAARPPRRPDPPAPAAPETPAESAAPPVEPALAAPAAAADSTPPEPPHRPVRWVSERLETRHALGFAAVALLVLAALGWATDPTRGGGATIPPDPARPSDGVPVVVAPEAAPGGPVVVAPEAAPGGPVVVAPAPVVEPAPSPIDRATPDVAAAPSASEPPTIQRRAPPSRPAAAPPTPAAAVPPRAAPGLAGSPPAARTAAAPAEVGLFTAPGTNPPAPREDPLEPVFEAPPIVLDPARRPTIDTLRHTAPPAPLTVAFDAEPAATIEVDGVALGPTPIEGYLLTPGEHRVVLRFEDGRRGEGSIRVEATRRRFAFRAR